MNNLTFNANFNLLTSTATIKETVLLPFWGMVEELIELIFGDGEE